MTVDNGTQATARHAWLAEHGMGLWTQMGAFSKGIVDTRYVVYDLTIALLSVTLSVRVLQADRGV